MLGIWGYEHQTGVDNIVHGCRLIRALTGTGTGTGTSTVGCDKPCLRGGCFPGSEEHRDGGEYPQQGPDATEHRQLAPGLAPVLDLVGFGSQFIGLQES